MYGAGVSSALDADSEKLSLYSWGNVLNYSRYLSLLFCSLGVSIGNFGKWMLNSPRVLSSVKMNAHMTFWKSNSNHSVHSKLVVVNATEIKFFTALYPTFLPNLFLINFVVKCVCYLFVWASHVKYMYATTYNSQSCQ